MCTIQVLRIPLVGLLFYFLSVYIAFSLPEVIALVSMHFSIIQANGRYNGFCTWLIKSSGEACYVGRLFDVLQFYWLHFQWIPI